MANDSALGAPLSQALAPYGELGAILLSLADASKALVARMARGALGGALDAPVGMNSDGDIQKALDILADDLFCAALAGTSARALASEEREAPTPLNPQGKFLVAIDPVDGYSNIDVNVTVGTIISVLDAPEGGSGAAEDFLQPGHRQRAAGLLIYGPHAAFAFSLGAGVHVATLDPERGEFIVTREHLHIPDGRAEFAINASNARHWPEAVRAYVDDCLMGETGPRAKNFNMRWVAAVAVDAYRVLQRGGIYLYPDDARAGHGQGRLRLIYEVNPIAFLVEQAGGMAIDGINRILDIKPTALHQRAPLIFGSTDKVERIRDYFVAGHRSAARAPLFAKRGLWRGGN